MSNKIYKYQQRIFDEELSLSEYKEAYTKFLDVYNMFRKKEEKKLSRLDLKGRQKLHPIILVIYTLKNRMDGITSEVVYDEHVMTNSPKIFVPTHVGKYDIGAISEVIKDHYYLLSGDYEHIQGTIEETFLRYNGVFYFQEQDKLDRKMVTEKMLDFLKSGGNLMWFPEGTWNLTPNLPVLPCYWGIVDIAKEAKAEIIPIGAEQYGMHFKIAIGKNINCAKYENDIIGKTQAITDIRDTLATLKWYIWESESQIKRTNITNEYWRTYVDDRLTEWNFKQQWIDEMVFKPKNVTTPEEAFAFMDKLIPSRENAFLLKRSR